MKTTKTTIVSRASLVLAACFGLWNATPALAAGGGGGGGGYGGGGGGGRGGGFNGGFGGGGAFGGFGGGGTSSSSTSAYPNNSQLGNVTASYDPETRSIIISTDDRTMASLTNLVHELDRPKPQALIKVVFLEVTHDNALDFGVEGSYGPQLGGNSITSIMTNIVANAAGGLTTNFLSPNSAILGGFGNNFGLASQGTTGSTIGQNTMPTGAGIYQVLGSDFQATVRAIASANNLEVLSRPSILVQNNQPATIQVGESVPIITSVTYAANTGLPIVTPTYQPVGIILQVTPFITADGLVDMIVSPQISSLSSQTVSIAPGYTAPVINQTGASTVVEIPDGQTVIIGGLMENDKASVDTKIPILGDIPILNMLFKRTQRDHAKTELLIFLTPHVVRMPSELAATTESESSRAEMARKAFTEKEYQQYFDSLPLKTPVKTGSK